MGLTLIFDLGHFKEKCKCRHLKNASLTCFLGYFMAPPVSYKFSGNHASYYMSKKTIGLRVQSFMQCLLVETDCILVVNLFVNSLLFTFGLCYPYCYLFIVSNLTIIKN